MNFAALLDFFEICKKRLLHEIVYTKTAFRSKTPIVWVVVLRFSSKWHKELNFFQTILYFWAKSRNVCLSSDFPKVYSSWWSSFTASSYFGILVQYRTVFFWLTVSLVTDCFPWFWELALSRLLLQPVPFIYLVLRG